MRYGHGRKRDCALFSGFVFTLLTAFGTSWAATTKQIPPADFGQAAGAPELTFRTAGQTPWFAVPGSPGYIQSGDISDNQESVVNTYVNGPASISFEWKVASESFYDILNASVDGKPVGMISGNVDWSKKIFFLRKGTHLVQFRYSKDATGTDRADAAYLRNVHVEQGEWVSDNLARRDRAQMVYDEVRDRFVIFGGTGTAAHEDTWTSTDATTWSLLTTDGPPARTAATMVYDSVRDRVVLFGGVDHDDASLDDTWELNGNTWSQRSPAQSPPARTDASMAYDPVEAKTYLFGGIAVTGAYLNDLWSWNGSQWAQLSAGGAETPSDPAPRSGASMTYDVTRGKLVLVGGTGISDDIAKATYEYDGQVWQQVATIGPEPRQGAVFVYNTTSGKSILLGGFKPNATTAVNNMYEWDGTKWLENHSAYLPTNRAYTAGAYDSQNNRIAVYGGKFSGNGTSVSGDSWSYQNGGWSLNSSVVGPDQFVNTAAAYDSNRNRVFAFISGYPSSFEYYEHAWHEFTTPNPPQPVRPPIMAYDPLRGLFLVYFENTYQFLYNAATQTWTQAANGGNLDTFSAKMSYNPLRHSIVGAGRNTSAEWDGSWGPNINKGLPEFSNLVFDELCQATTTYSRGNWFTFSGTDWVNVSGNPQFVSTVNNPPSLAYDNASDRNVATGTFVSNLSGTPSLVYLIVRTCGGETIPLPGTGPAASSGVQTMVETSTNAALAVGGAVATTSIPGRPGIDVWRFKSSPPPSPTHLSQSSILLGDAHGLDGIFGDVNGDGIFDAADLSTGLPN